MALPHEIESLEGPCVKFYSSWSYCTMKKVYESKVYYFFIFIKSQTQILLKKNKVSNHSDQPLLIIVILLSYVVLNFSSISQWEILLTITKPLLEIYLH